MNPLLTEMSPLERKYFKLYARAVKKDFDVISTAAYLMQPAELGLSCPVQACHVAVELLDLQAKFVGALTLIAHKNKMRRRHLPPHPDDETLAKLIAASFFKVLAVVNSPYVAAPVQKDAGWFSGGAEDWQKNIAALKVAWKPKHAPFSGILSAILQLFHAAQNTKLSFGGQYIDGPAPHDEEWPDEDEDPSAPEEFD